MTLLLEADMNNTERLLPNPGLFTTHDHIPTSLAEKHRRINYKNFRNVKKKLRSGKDLRRWVEHLEITGENTDD